MSQCCSQKRIFGGANRNEGKFDRRAFQTLRRFGVDIAVAQLNLCSKRFHRFEVQVDGSRANGTTTGQRDDRLPGARQHWSEHEN